MEGNKLPIAQWIDHTLLKVDASQSQIENLCNESIQYQTYSVCVNPQWIPVAYKMLQGTPIKKCTVIGFPLGSTFLSTLLIETEMAIMSGADEIDMVINVGALKSGDSKRVLNEMKIVTELAHTRNVLVKIIVESVVLTLDEKIHAAHLVVESGADFLKTSTGFVSNPNLVDDVKLFLRILPEGFKIKASGGIHDYSTAIRLLNMGVQRIGTSSTVKIIEEEQHI